MVGIAANCVLVVHIGFALLLAVVVSADCPLGRDDFTAARTLKAVSAAKCDPKLLQGVPFCNACRCAIYNSIADTLAEAGQPASDTLDILNCLTAGSYNFDRNIPLRTLDALATYKCATTASLGVAAKSGVSAAEDSATDLLKKLGPCLSPAAKVAFAKPPVLRPTPCILNAAEIASMDEFKSAVRSGSCAALRTSTPKDCQCICELTTKVLGPVGAVATLTGYKDIKQLSYMLAGCINELLLAAKTSAGFTPAAFKKLNSTECRGVYCGGPGR